MSEMFSFENLTLGHVQAATAAVILTPGRYICKTSDAKMKPTKNGDGMSLHVRLTDVKGKGMITAILNIHLPKSAEGTRIGQEQLKSLLQIGGHPDPENPGQHGIHSINGLTVGVVVRKETYMGEDRAKVAGFVPPSSIPGYEDDPAFKDDSIPF